MYRAAQAPQKPTCSLPPSTASIPLGHLPLPPAARPLLREQLWRQLEPVGRREQTEAAAAGPERASKHRDYLGIISYFQFEVGPPSWAVDMVPRACSSEASFPTGRFRNRHFPGGSVVENLPPTAGEAVRSLGREDPLEQEMATPPGFLPKKPHGRRSLVGLESTGSQRSQTRLCN